MVCMADGLIHTNMQEKSIQGNSLAWSTLHPAHVTAQHSQSMFNTFFLLHLESTLPFIHSHLAA
jgi:hypothetical protein